MHCLENIPWYTELSNYSSVATKASFKTSLMLSCWFLSSSRKTTFITWENFVSSKYFFFSHLALCLPSERIFLCVQKENAERWIGRKCFSSYKFSNDVVSDVFFTNSDVSDFPRIFAAFMLSRYWTKSGMFPAHSFICGWTHRSRWACGNPLVWNSILMLKLVIFSPKILRFVFRTIQK